MNLLCKIFFIFLLFTTNTLYAQLPNNIGFESGNLSGWEKSIGKRSLMGGDIMDEPTTIPYPDRFIVYGAGSKYEMDPYGDFPVLCPNGSKHSIKIGNDVASGKMQRVTYTFDIPAGVSSYSLIFNYAVVLENPPHAHDQQPLFSARVYNVSDGNYVSCPAFDFAASSALPGFKLSEKVKDRILPQGGVAPGLPVYYKDWSTAMINLTAYAGKKIRLEFTSQDCRPSGHFGYAYLDIDEELSLRPVSGNIFCKDQEFITLNGPNGFKEYTWYNDGDLSKSIGNEQNLTIEAEPNKKYVLKIVPYDNETCVDFLNVTLQELDAPFKLVVQPTPVYGCPGTGFDLTSANVTAGSSTMKFSYYKDKFGLEYLPNPDRVLSSGMYYIRGTNLGGCTDIQPIEVIIASPEISVNQPLPVRYPTKVDLSTTFTHIAGVTYDYYTDVAATIPMVDFSINVSGTYYIKATSGVPCSVIVPVKVVVNPPPPYTIEAPNTFTPNGDGVNDFFKVKIDGFVTLTQLTIFNRYGQQVFATRSINDYWTGTSSGSALPNGTYYWIFEGTDDYFHTKMKKASSITIVR